MSERNPYAAPTALVADVVPEYAIGQDAERRRLKELAGGQRMILWALLVGITAAVLLGSAAALMSDSRFAVIVLLAMLLPLFVMGAGSLGMVGAIRVAHGLWSSVGLDVLVALVAWIPLLNLAVLLFLTLRATRELRAGGYVVGLLGARMTNAA